MRRLKNVEMESLTRKDIATAEAEEVEEVEVGAAAAIVTGVIVTEVTVILMIGRRDVRMTELLALRMIARMVAMATITRRVAEVAEEVEEDVAMMDLVIEIKSVMTKTSK